MGTGPHVAASRRDVQRNKWYRSQFPWKTSRLSPATSPEELCLLTSALVLNDTAQVLGSDSQACRARVPGQPQPFIRAKALPPQTMLWRFEFCSFFCGNLDPSSTTLHSQVLRDACCSDPAVLIFRTCGPTISSSHCVSPSIWSELCAEGPQSVDFQGPLAVPLRR